MTDQVAARNADLKARYPRIDDPREAINFALSDLMCGDGVHLDAFDFLETWRDGAWVEIEQAYPEFLAQVGT